MSVQSAFYSLFTHIAHLMAAHERGIVTEGLPGRGWWWPLSCSQSFSFHRCGYSIKHLDVRLPAYCVFVGLGRCTIDSVRHSAAASLQ